MAKELSNEQVLKAHSVAIDVILATLLEEKVTQDDRLRARLEKLLPKELAHHLLEETPMMARRKARQAWRASKPKGH